MKTKYVHLRIREGIGCQETCLVDLGTGRVLFSVVETDYEDGDKSRLIFVDHVPASGIPTYMLDCKDTGIFSGDAMSSALRSIRAIEGWRRKGEKNPENLFQVVLVKGEGDRKPNDYGVVVRWAKDACEDFPGDDDDEEEEDEE